MWEREPLCLHGNSEAIGDHLLGVPKSQRCDGYVGSTWTPTLTLSDAAPQGFVEFSRCDRGSVNDHVKELSIALKKFDEKELANWCLDGHPLAFAREGLGVPPESKDEIHLAPRGFAKPGAGCNADGFNCDPVFLQEKK